jgi:hypothetical protein
MRWRRPQFGPVHGGGVLFGAMLVPWRASGERGSSPPQVKVYDADVATMS